MSDKNKPDLSKTNSSHKDSKQETENPIETLIPDEILKDIPVEDRGKLVSIIKETQFSGMMRRGNPIAAKITENHITQIIERSDLQDLRDRDERKSQRIYNLGILLIGLIFLGFLIVFLKEDTEILYKIIIAVISFVGGFGLGKTGIGNNTK